MKRIFLSGLMLVLVLLLGGCSLRNSTRGYRPIDDIHNLDGRRVAVQLAWSADYLLSGREDIELMRYDTLADSVVALCYRRVDAIAIERVFAAQVLGSVEGLRILEEPIEQTAVIAYVSNDRPDVLEQFNAFVSEFKGSAEYAELMSRVRGMETAFEERHVEATGTGPVLRVGLENSAYPFIYYNIEDEKFYGIDVEIMTYFANEHNYRLEFVEGTYDSMIQSVTTGKLDICVSGLSEMYRDEVELSGRALVSDPYMDVDIVFIEIEDHSKLKVTSPVED